MDNVFTLGISSLWDEVCHMPVGGVWWLNVNRYADAVSLFNQTLAAQAKNSHVAALVMGNKPKDIISLDHIHGPDNIALFTLPNRPQALEEIHRDLVCSLEPGNYLFILLCAENAWQNINNEKGRKAQPLGAISPLRVLSDQFRAGNRSAVDSLIT